MKHLKYLEKLETGKIIFKMYKALIFLILVICNGCSTAISKEVIRLDSQVVTTSSPEIVENKLKETPFDIWERIPVSYTHLRAHET